jgi:hypothetical protein
MGQQQMVAGSALRRIILALAVAALMAAIMAASAIPALAKNSIHDGFDDPPGPPEFSGSTSFDNNGSNVNHREGGGGSCVDHFDSDGFTKNTGHCR